MDLEAIVGTMLTDLAATEQDVKNIYKVGLNTTRLLMASGDVVVGYLLLKGAAVAAEKLRRRPPPRTRPFYTGKIAAAKFFAANVLPGVSLARKLAEGVDTGPDGAGRGRVLGPSAARFASRLRRPLPGRRRTADPGAPVAVPRPPHTPLRGPAPIPGSGPSRVVKVNP